MQSTVVKKVSKDAIDFPEEQFVLKDYPIDVSMQVYDNGDVYIGQQLNGERSGLGTLYYKNGNVHTGNWYCNIKSGCGIYFTKRGTKYIGKWTDDELNWTNTEIEFKDGSRYVGAMTNNKITGYGRIKYKNGDVYQGMWKAGKWHGSGEVLYKNGDRLTGEFNENTLVKRIE
jgi:hypothetical protein